MKIIDISWPISPAMTTYKNRIKPSFEMVVTEGDDFSRSSSFSMGSHDGTHVDAPAHFFSDGKMMQDILLERLVGPCRVIDCVAETIDSRRIDAAIIKKIQPTKGERLLFKTANSLQPPTALFDDSFVYLADDAAALLAESLVGLVGIDALGIERKQKRHATHRILFAQDIVIVEGLCLNAVDHGSYHFCCLPLALQEMEAAPARAILTQ